MLLLLLFTFLLVSVHAAENVRYELNEDTSLSLAQGTNSFQLNIPPRLNSSHTLEISTAFDVPGSKTSGAQSKYFRLVDFVVYYGHRSLSWRLSNRTRSSTNLMCFEGSPDFTSITIIAQAREPDVKIRFAIRKEDIKLRFGHERRDNVTLGHPLTFLVDPVSGADASRKDRYLIRVGNADPATAGVCMLVAAYSNACPFKNRPDNLRNAEVWLTALEKGAMTLRYESYRFNEPFYVSVVILDHDAECHLPGETRVTTLKDLSEPELQGRGLEGFFFY